MNKKVREITEEDTTEGNATIHNVLLMELVEKSQMQQTIYDALKMLDEWEYESKLVEDAKSNLRNAACELNKEIEEIQDSVDGENKNG